MMIRHMVIVGLAMLAFAIIGCGSTVGETGIRPTKTTKVPSITDGPVTTPNGEVISQAEIKKIAEREEAAKRAHEEELAEDPCDPNNEKPLACKQKKEAEEYHKGAQEYEEEQRQRAEGR